MIFVNFANQIIASGLLAKHFNLGATPMSFGVYTNMTDQNEFDYSIGCLRSACSQPSKNLIAHTLPGSRYAKFTLNRTDRIKEAWHYIYGYWFPQNDLYRTAGFDFEIYRADGVDIYIPMNK